MSLEQEINDGFGEYQHKHNTIPDILFVNNSTAAYLRKNAYEFNVFGKPVKEVTMDLPFLWIDNKTLDKGKNKLISEGESGVEVYVDGLVIRRYEGQKLESRAFEPVYIPIGVLNHN